jgi:outer membrane lipoprotein-sorting protein
LRGSTIGQANFGSLLAHLQSLDRRNVRVMTDGAKDILWTRVTPAPPDDDVTSEAYLFGRDGFPTEYFQYGANKKVLKHVVYSGRKLNVDLPASTFSL